MGLVLNRRQCTARVFLLMHWQKKIEIVFWRAGRTAGPMRTGAVRASSQQPLLHSTPPPSTVARDIAQPDAGRARCTSKNTTTIESGARRPWPPSTPRTLSPSTSRDTTHKTMDTSSTQVWKFPWNHYLRVIFMVNATDEQDSQCLIYWWLTKWKFLEN